ncbi:hypothetical protein [Microbispora sp. H10949]|uniref:hypothetical protein n=1 Tax=Microbispora sp. H10949 TaxID=2729111 RepID=UPI0016030D48|nr:hypothetical protein [Microbispora sp. H10949]
MDPAGVHDLEQFTAALDALRASRSYGHLDRAVRPQKFPSSTLSDLLNKGRCTVETLELFLRACAVPRSEWEAWRQARERVLSPAPPGLPGLMRVAAAHPRRLGVHAPIDAPGAVGELPVYVLRDTDTAPGGVRALIGQAAEHGGLVVIVGGSSVGKTRCAYEALRAVVPTWWLLHPTGPEQVRQAAEQPPPHLVVWLDELQNYLGGPTGLDAGTVRALLQAGAVLVATIWPDRYHAFTALSQPDQTDQYATERELLGLADVAHLDADFTPTERERARAAAQEGDARIALALESTDYGLTQVIAAAPHLVTRWQAADPYAAAVLNAAIDATRLGVRSPLSAELLRAAAPGYCTSHERATAPANWFEAALAYATKTLHGATAALAPVATATMEMGQVGGYRIADYLQQHAGVQRRMVKVPATCWQALCDHLTQSDDQRRAGDAAMDRLLYRYAEPLLRRAADVGDGQAIIWLTGLLAEQGRVEELRARADAGDGSAASRLARLLAEQGRVEELQARADAGDGSAASRLIDLLAGQGRVEELRARADAGDGLAASRLARLLAEQGRVEELQARADAGDGLAAIGLARLLAKQGQVEEALAILQARADAGDGLAAIWLVRLLAEQGRVEELQARADAGDGLAAIGLARLLAKQGQMEELTRYSPGELRTRADAGDGQAASQSADLLAKQGQVEELRARVDVGDTAAINPFLDTLARDQPEEAAHIRRHGLSADPQM